MTHTDTKVQRYRVLLARSGTSVQCMKECWHVSVSTCINTTIHSHHHLHQQYTTHTTNIPLYTTIYHCIPLYTTIYHCILLYTTVHYCILQYITVTFNVHAYNTHRYMYMCMVVRSACTMYKGIMIMQSLLLLMSPMVWCMKEG